MPLPPVRIASLDAAAEYAASAPVAVELASEDPGRIIVTGSLTDGTNPVTFPALLPVGLSDPAELYTADGGVVTDGGIEYVALVTFPGVVLTKRIDGTDVATWTSSEAVDYPTQVIAWAPTSPATGTPTVAKSVAPPVSVAL